MCVYEHVECVQMCVLIIVGVRIYYDNKKHVSFKTVTCTVIKRLILVLPLTFFFSFFAL